MSEIWNASDDKTCNWKHIVMKLEHALCFDIGWLNDGRSRCALKNGWLNDGRSRCALKNGWLNEVELNIDQCDIGTSECIMMYLVSISFMGMGKVAQTMNRKPEICVYTGFGFYPANTHLHMYIYIYV